MNRCKRCGIDINDETSRCLFCGMVLSGDGSSTENIYPDIRNKTRMLKRTINIITYFAVVLEIFLIVINYYNYYGIKWSVITGGALFYLVLPLNTFILVHGKISSPPSPRQALTSIHLLFINLTLSKTALPMICV